MARFLYDRQTVIAGVLAFAAAFGTVAAPTRHDPIPNATNHCGPKRAADFEVTIALATG